MSRRISQSITPTTDDVSTLRDPFITKGANDPVIVELRAHMKGTVPAWLAKLSVEQELTSDRLREIQAASAARRAVIEALPEGKARADALAALDRVDVVVNDMDKELTGVSAFSGVGL